MSELQIRGVSKQFGSTSVLKNINLDVPANSMTALLGPSGSGKTTLLRLLCGFEQTDTGTIKINDTLLTAPGVFIPPEQRRIGYVPQEGVLFPHLTVADNITFGLPFQQRKHRSRVAELLDLVGLPVSFANRSPQALSGGQQQRVALARALAPTPSLVLLDEPFSSLDATSRAETRQAIANALSEAGTTVLLVTHDQSEALLMGSQVAVLWDGRMIQAGAPEQLYQQPVSAELAHFIGEAVLLQGEVKDHITVVCALGCLPLITPQSNSPVQVLLRPEQILLQPCNPETEGAGIPGRVLHVEYFGHDACVHLQLLNGAAIPCIVKARVAGYARPRQGDSVMLAVQGKVMAYQPG